MPNDRFFFDSDDDGHWYIVPVELKSVFYDLMEKSESSKPGSDEWNDACDQINEKFGEHRIDGWPSNYSFENPKKED